MIGVIIFAILSNYVVYKVFTWCEHKNESNFTILPSLFYNDNKNKLTWSDKHPCSYNDEKLAKCPKIMQDMEE